MTLFQMAQTKHLRVTDLMARLTEEVAALDRQKEAIETQYHALSMLQKSLADVMLGIERIESIDPPGPIGMLEVSP